MTTRYELRDGVAVIILDRPDKLNALTVEMREALGTHFETAARDPAVRAVLLQATGKAFCASGDVSKMGDFTPETARFTQVFRHVGLVPDGGAIYFLTQHLGVQRAKELVYSGRRIDAQEAHAMGLVNRVVADEELDATAFEYARELATGPTFALGVAKKMFKLMHQPDLETLLDAEAWAQGLTLLTEDHAEGVRAFFEKRKPVFQGR